MKIKTFTFFLLAILIGCSKSNTKKNEDYFSLYDRYELDDEIKEKKLDSLFSHFITKHNDSLTRHSLFKVAYRYQKLGLDKKYYSTINTINILASEKKDTLDIAQSLRYKGDFYESKEIFDSAFYYYSQSEKLYRLSKKDSLNWGKVLLYKAGILYDTGIYTESEIETIKAIIVFSKINNQWFLYRSNLQMGLNLEELKEYEDALKYHVAALQQLDKLEKENFPKDKINKSRISCYNNIGGLYNKMGNYSEAEKYYIKGLSFIEIEENPKLHAMLLNNYAHSKMLSENIKKTDSLLFLALKIRENIGHEQGIIASKIRLGEFYLNRNDTIQALQNIYEAYNLSINNKSHLYILNCLEFLRENDIKIRIIIPTDI